MSKEPTVSIIIPIYNAEKYLAQCLGSVVAQSYGNIEIICVNDGSVDGSDKVIDMWSNKDTRIKKVNIKNSGANIARKAGVKKASGEFIAFVDSDDLMHVNNIKNNLDCLRRTRADMSVNALVQFADCDTNNLSDDTGNLRPDVIVGMRNIFQFLICGDRGDIYSMVPWGKLYKKELFDHIDWDKIDATRFNDELLLTIVYEKCQKITLLPQKLSYYRDNGFGQSDQKQLSKQLVDLKFQGKPSSILEIIYKIYKLRDTIITKNQLGLERENYDWWFHNSMYRTNQLIRRDAICDGNNLKYFKKVWQENERRQQSMLPEKATHVARLKQSEQRITQLENEINLIMNSRSWKITKPLRAIGRVFKH